MALAGNALVSGAVSLAARMGVSPLVAGIFIVGFGTSAPEMIVSLDAALSDRSGLALGNIVGSNIANVFLVLGLPALIAPIAAGGVGEKRGLIAVIVAAVAWIGITALMPLTPIGRPLLHRASDCLFGAHLHCSAPRCGRRQGPRRHRGGRPAPAALAGAGLCPARHPRA
jgi:hypothetical protein